MRGKHAIQHIIKSLWGLGWSAHRFQYHLMWSLAGDHLMSISPCELWYYLRLWSKSFILPTSVLCLFLFSLRPVRNYDRTVHRNLCILIGKDP